MLKDYMHELDSAFSLFTAPDIKEMMQKTKPKDIRTLNREFWQRDDDASTAANKFVF